MNKDGMRWALVTIAAVITSFATATVAHDLDGGTRFFALAMLCAIFGGLGGVVISDKG